MRALHPAFLKALPFKTPPKKRPLSSFGEITCCLSKSPHSSLSWRETNFFLSLALHYIWPWIFLPDLWILAEWHTVKWEVWWWGGGFVTAAGVGRGRGDHSGTGEQVPLQPSLPCFLTAPGSGSQPSYEDCDPSSWIYPLGLLWVLSESIHEK